MKFDTHVANRFLKDDSFIHEILETQFPAVYKNGEDPTKNTKLMSLYALLRTEKGHKPYFVTNSVLDKLSLIKVKKKDVNGKMQYDWRVFESIKDGTCATFIFPFNRDLTADHRSPNEHGGRSTLLRMVVSGNTIAFAHVEMVPKETFNQASVNWVLFYVDRKTGFECEHFEHNDVKSIEDFIFHLLCFMYLTDNEEIIVNLNAKYGTKKGGNMVNTLGFPLVIVNNNWNVTSIRNEEFSVSGHFAIRHVGEGRTQTRLVWIDPFVKHGYVRKAKNNKNEK